MIGTDAFSGRAKCCGIHINMELANIQNFNQTIGNQAFELKVLLSDGEPWFRATDVAGILGYRNKRQAIGVHVDEEDKATLADLMSLDSRLLLCTYEKAQIFISESGLYSLILKSKKQEAKMFKRWVTTEVLPQIRRTGTYEAQRTESTSRASQQGELAASVQQVRRIALENDELELRKLVSIRQAFLDAGEELDAAQRWSFRDGLNNLMNSCNGKGQERLERQESIANESSHQLVDTGEFLTRKGFKASDVKKMRSTFGKLAASIKRQERGLDKNTVLPWKLKNVGGHETKVNVYKLPEELSILEEAFVQLQNAPQYATEMTPHRPASTHDRGRQRTLNWNYNAS